VETMDGPLAIERAVERLAQRVEWVLVDGRAEEDLQLTPRHPQGGSRRAHRARSVAGTQPASGKGTKK
jgi:hypothetical protein